MEDAADHRAGLEASLAGGGRCRRSRSAARDGSVALAAHHASEVSSLTTRPSIGGLSSFGRQIAGEVKKRRVKIGTSWRLDETYFRVNGKWKYLYRAVDKVGDTVDFLLTAKRDRKAAKRFLNKAIGDQPRPLKINIDKSGANEAGIKAYIEDVGASIEIRKCKYLNNIVEQDHRWVRRRTRAALGFKAFHSAHATLAGVEAVRMISKGQLRPEFRKDLGAALFPDRKTTLR